VLIFSLVPWSLKSSFQNKLMNMVSLSLTIEAGIPCNLTTSLTKVSATDLAEYGCLRGIKWPYLLSLSTTTKMESYPLDLGNLVIKSMLISSHTAAGIGKG